MFLSRRAARNPVVSNWQHPHALKACLLKRQAAQHPGNLPGNASGNLVRVARLGARFAKLLLTAE
jgi:hypothetical protein